MPASDRGGPEPKKALLKIRRATLFRRPGRLTALRAVAHLGAWLPFILGPARLIQHGWRPVGDEAAIALRSWNSLTAHGPMVGQATRLAHGGFDPGPLEYWLLAIPVHIDTVRGVLWGAVICCPAPTASGRGSARWRAVRQRADPRPDAVGAGHRR